MKQAAANELRQLLNVLQRELGDRNFFCGELSLADFAAICYVPGAKAMDVSLGEFDAAASLD
jgi:glutathione S-transferase